MEPSSSTSSRLELIKVLKRRDYYSQHTVYEYSIGLIKELKTYTVKWRALTHATN